ADRSGNIMAQQSLEQLPPKFTVTATGQFYTAAASTGNPSANLDQCASGAVATPQGNSLCDASNEWVNGNLNGSKAHYLEGDSIPYRLTMANLSLVSHTVTIEW